jgi:hypothetical protein
MSLSWQRRYCTNLKALLRLTTVATVICAFPGTVLAQSVERLDEPEGDALELTEFDTSESSLLAEEDGPPKRYTTDVNNVDLGSGKLTIFAQEGGIGNLSRTVVRRGQAKDSWDLWFCYQSVVDTTVVISHGLTRQDIEGSSSGGASLTGYDQLVYGTTTHTLYRENGDIVTYDASMARPDCYVGGRATQITKPNGEKIKLHYKTVVVSGVTSKILKSVTSSFGYQIQINSGNDGIHQQHRGLLRSCCRHVRIFCSLADRQLLYVGHRFHCN